MGSWFTCVKRLFTPTPNPNKYQEKRRRLKFRRRRCDPAAQGPPRRTLREAADEQRKQAVAVAVATAAAADAAVAAANAAVEVVRLTNAPYEVGKTRIFHVAAAAAARIQTAYRGHLARKALSALKGIVKLQAVVRGELVRKKILKKLAYISLFSKARPLLDLHRARVRPMVDNLCHMKRRHSFVVNEGFKSKEFKLHCNTHRSLDLSFVSNEATAKRECMRQCSFSHRERRNDQNLQEQTSLKRNTSIHLLQHEVHNQLEKTENLLKPMSRSTSMTIDSTRLAQLKLRKHEIAEGLNSPSSQSRRSFCHISRNKSISDYGSLPNSPVFPAYMAATESTKAKSRSFSTPRQRLRLCESYAGPYSLHKLGLSSCGSFNGETIPKNEKTNCNV
ncbi:Unknown protein [Striga hermonthica]|uniref:DUF4005 domain-containing protein n=1 Tax=Striga hermonthica TaxID=68872 RepID=A0A9N7RJ07_STRHE|nr:Unknown protein [Striga hermonthica]